MAYFLLGLQTLDDGSQLGEDLVGLLVIVNLGGDELRQVAKGLRRVQNLKLELSVASDRRLKGVSQIRNEHSSSHRQPLQWK